MGASLSECSACYVVDVHRGAWHGALHRAVLQGQPSRFSREYTGISASLPPYFLDSRLFSVLLLVISGLCL